MPRPTTKADLLAAATHEFDRLWATVETVPTADREQAGACEEWSVKDVLAHLDAWHEMLLGWERAGAAGEVPEIPGGGYTWADLPALNQAIFERTRGDSWDDVVDRLQRSHEAVLARIEPYDDEDLFTKKRYAWTRTTSVGSYFVSATSSHYAWASKLVRAWVRTPA